jgi:hypothetical protein
MLSFSRSRPGHCRQVALLQFQHLQVFAEDLALAFADLRRQRLVVGLKLRAMPQKYHIEVSVSGVMKSTTMLETLRLGGRVVTALPRQRHARPRSSRGWAA